MMTKTELISKLADRLWDLDHKVSKKLSADMLNTLIDCIIEGVKEEEEVRIQGFGTFKKSKREAREGRNPKTSEKIRIEAMSLPTFKAGAEFKKAIK